MLILSVSDIAIFYFVIQLFIKNFRIISNKYWLKIIII